MFLGGVKWVHWPEMGSSKVCANVFTTRTVVTLKLNGNLL